MSLSGALNSAVSGLNSQASALAMIATNLANSSTVGYKSVSASFATMLNGGGNSGPVGGVKVMGLVNVGAQGLSMPSQFTTNMMVSGEGFFVTASGPGANDFKYTRNGEFVPNEEGFLVNSANGQFLQGWATDEDGNIIGGTSDGNLEAIDVDKYSSIVGATTKAGLSAVLPLNATIGAAGPPVVTADKFTSSMQVFDSMGTAANVEITWEKTGVNTWRASFGDAKLAGDATKTVGTLGAATATLVFDADGNLQSASTPALNIAWNTGATTPAAVALDFSGMSQANQTVEEGGALTVELTVDQDGKPFGKLNGIEIGKAGEVIAHYSNNMMRTLYKIPVATFANANGLTASSGGLYSVSGESGTATLRQAHQNGAADILGATLEMSTTDTNQEFASMMTAQQAYSGNAQVMSAANSMFDTLIGAVR